MNLLSEILLILPTKSNQFRQKFLMVGTYLLFFNVESLLTYVPLQLTINAILDRVYNNKLIAT